MITDRDRYLASAIMAKKNIDEEIQRLTKIREEKITELFQETGITASEFEAEYQKYLEEVRVAHCK